MLVDSGLSVTLIQDSDLPTVVLSDYDVILIADDSQAYLDTSAVGEILGSGKPVVGLGVGGGSYFDTIGLTIGMARQAFWLNERGLVPYLTSNRIFHQPCEVCSSPLDIYLNAQWSAAVEWSHASPNAVSYASWPDPFDDLNPLCSPLCSEGDCLFWGFYADPGLFTTAGRELFANAVWYAASL
jgi:hypothetical protein